MFETKSKIKRKIGGVTFLFFLIWYVFLALPKPLFNKPTSTLAFSAERELLGGVIAADGQWRFPQNDSIPYKIKECATYFEDEYFYYHWGVNPVSLFRAFKDNFIKNRITSGGSTITMQTIRLAYDNPKRTYWEKFKELILATRLEFSYSKDEILNLYLSNAPFGGNVVGIDAASWRYYKRLSNDLSWGEAATLAVLPNAPSLIYPGKNQEKLKEKRNRLLNKLYKDEVIDKTTYELAIEETLPQKPNYLPQIAPHLVQWVKRKNEGERIFTTIKMPLQQHLNTVIKNHQWYLDQKKVHNIAALIVDVKTGGILAYTGNTKDKENKYSNQVDIIQAPRSSGSILKPFLYQSMLNEGQLLPSMLVPDIPYKNVKNFYKKYDGAVRADKALARSLNVPAVYELQQYGVNKFLHDLKNYGFQHFTKTSDYYGLSLIIGGGEITLLELAQAYANMAYQLEYNEEEQKFIKTHFNTEEVNDSVVDYSIKPSATFLTFKALKEVVRPSSEVGWQNFNPEPIAWKTGTSHGFRDAWAVGVTPQYVVAVWAGNADGEGRPNMTGTRVAAPILFDIFDRLNTNQDFTKPKYIPIRTKICRSSGYKYGEYCEEYDYVSLPKFSKETPLCPYHEMLFLDKSKQFQVNSACYKVDEMVRQKQFILPPKMAWFYQRKNPFYKRLPPFLGGCKNSRKGIDLIYPKKMSKIYLPTNLDETKEKVIFEAVHSNASSTIFWHIDNEFIKETHYTHKIEIQPNVGKHILTLTDLEGNEFKRTFEVVQ